MAAYNPPAVLGRRATIELPDLTTEQAMLLFEILSDIASALWGAHEPEIGDLAANQAVHEAALREHEEAAATCFGDAGASAHGEDLDDDLLF